MTHYQMNMLRNFGAEGGGILLGKLEIIMRDFGFMTP